MRQVGPVQPTPFAIEAVIRAYTDCGEWLEALKHYLDKNMNWTEEFLRKNLPHVGFRKPEGTYIIWMDFSAYGTEDEVYARLNHHANLVLDRGSNYGESGFIRACIPVSRKLLEEIFERIYKEFGKDDIMAS